MDYQQGERAGSPAGRNRLSVGDGAGAPSLRGGGLQHCAELTARRDWSDRLFRRRVAGGLSGFRAAEADVTQRELRGGRGVRTPAAAALHAPLAVEPQLAFVQQQLHEVTYDPDANDWAARDSLRSGQVWGAGLVAELALPLHERWLLAVEARATGLSVPIWDGTRRAAFAPEVGASLAWTF